MDIYGILRQVEEGLVAATVGAMFGAFGVSKSLRFWRKDRNAEVRSDFHLEAERSVIMLLQRQVDRLEEQNTKMLEALSTLQVQNVELQRQNHQLRTEINHLKELMRSQNGRKEYESDH